MRRIFYRLAVAWIIGLGFGLPSVARAADGNGAQRTQTQVGDTDMVVPDKQDSGVTSPSDPSLCLDEMETVPFDDDLEPVPIAVDGGCKVSEAPISI